MIVTSFLPRFLSSCCIWQLSVQHSPPLLLWLKGNLNHNLLRMTDLNWCPSYWQLWRKEDRLWRNRIISTSKLWVDPREDPGTVTRRISRLDARFDRWGDKWGPSAPDDVWLPGFAFESSVDHFMKGKKMIMVVMSRATTKNRPKNSQPELASISFCIWPAAITWTKPRQRMVLTVLLIWQMPHVAWPLPSRVWSMPVLSGRGGSMNAQLFAVGIWDVCCWLLTFMFARLHACSCLSLSCQTLSITTLMLWRT